MTHYVTIPIYEWPGHSEVFFPEGAPRPEYQESVVLVRKVLSLNYSHRSLPSFITWAPLLPEFKRLLDRFGADPVSNIIGWLAESPKAEWWREKPFKSCKTPFNLIASFIRNFDKLHLQWLEDPDLSCE